MNQFSRHADRVYECSQRASAAVSSPVAASWRRCLTLHGLTPEQSRSPVRLTDGEFRQARERSGALIAEADGELSRLFATVGKAGCCLVLTDEHGIALERRGTAGDDAEFRSVGLWSGTVWSEASAGTNGIGTAIADERAVVIQRDQHFLSCNIGLSCATAPIRDEKGRLAATIDVSTCRYDTSEALLAILSQSVRDAARRIEANLFRRAFSGARILLVPDERAFPALLAVDHEDFVVGANRAARQLLGLDDKRITGGVLAAALLNDAGPEYGCKFPDAERGVVRRTLLRANGNVAMAADLLGISRATLYRKMKRLSLN